VKEGVGCQNGINGTRDGCATACIPYIPCPTEYRDNADPQRCFSSSDVGQKSGWYISISHNDAKEDITAGATYVLFLALKPLAVKPFR
jgi:hypothetical protein